MFQNSTLAYLNIIAGESVFPTKVKTEFVTVKMGVSKCSSGLVGVPSRLKKD